MPSSSCAIVNTSSDTQKGRVVSRAMARDPTMLLTAYQPLALTQFKRAGTYAPRRPKLWRVNASWGIPISGPMLAVSASKPHPMRFPTRMAITPSAKPRPKTIASAPTSQTGSPMLAESQSVNNARGRPCRSLAETCSIPCGSTFSTCPRYSPPASSRFSLELNLLIGISFVPRIDSGMQSFASEGLGPIHFKEETIWLCHPERSEGSLSGERSFAPLRMTILNRLRLARKTSSLKCIGGKAHTHHLNSCELPQAVRNQEEKRPEDLFV